MKQVEQIQQAILEALSLQPNSNPTQSIQEQFGISREAVRLHLNRLISEGKIQGQGYGKGRVYFSINPQESFLQKTFDTKYLRDEGEDAIYAQIIEPFLRDKLNPGLIARIRHTSTEMLNNVIDHSQSKNVVLTIDMKPDQLNLQISDDGVGAFETIKEYFHLANFYEAIGELAKGKRTRDPANHAGEGIFFSSRMANFFSLTANEITYEYDSKKEDWTTKRSLETKGTTVRLVFDLADIRNPKEIFEKYTEDFAFVLKSPRLTSPYIIAMPKGEFPSRSEAKKILAGAANFKSIVVDFRDVEAIGQGFADEMFRVFPSQYPGIEIEVINANDFVQRMIAHVKRN